MRKKLTTPLISNLMHLQNVSISVENDLSKSPVSDGFRRNCSLHHLEVTVSFRTCKYTANQHVQVYKARVQLVGPGIGLVGPVPC